MPFHENKFTIVDMYVSFAFAFAFGFVFILSSKCKQIENGSGKHSVIKLLEWFNY